MLAKTNFKNSPWIVVNAEDKKTTRIAIITDLLNRLKYKNKNEKLLSKKTGLVYPASPENIKGKLYK